MFLAIATLIVALVGGILEILFLRRIYKQYTSFQLLLTSAFVLIISQLFGHDKQKIIKIKRKSL